MQREIKLDYYWCSYCNGFHLTSSVAKSEEFLMKFLEI